MGCIKISDSGNDDLVKGIPWYTYYDKTQYHACMQHNQ